MSESYAVMPVDPKVRAWLESEGLHPPTSNGRAISFSELRMVVSALPLVKAYWKTEGEFQDGFIKSSNGWETNVIIGEHSEPGLPCEYHFKGGRPEFIVQIVGAIAAQAGPHVIYAHSGAFTQIVS
jgi:hypothetical protein